MTRFLPRAVVLLSRRLRTPLVLMTVVPALAAILALGSCADDGPALDHSTGDFPAPAAMSGEEADLTFQADWETGDLSQWDEELSVDDDRIRVVDERPRQGEHAARFELRPGDDEISTGERAELARDFGGDESEGDAHYYGWSARFPEDWSEPPGWGIIMQFHSPFFETPPVAVDVRESKIRVRGNGGDVDDDDRERFGGTIVEDFERDVWHDFIMYVRWDRDDGEIRVWHKLADDDTWRLALDLDDVANIHARRGRAEKNGMRVGLYRDEGSDEVNVVYLDNVRRGSSLEAVAATAG